MLPKKHEEAFNHFYELAKNNEILDVKTTAMIDLTVSLSIDCVP